MSKAIELQDLSSESGLGVCRVGWGRVVICGGGHWRGTSVGFCVERCAAGNVQFLFFGGFLLMLPGF